jgi:hypothetical protein
MFFEIGAKGVLNISAQLFGIEFPDFQSEIAKGAVIGDDLIDVRCVDRIAGG